MAQSVTLLPDEIDQLREFQARYNFVTKRYGELKFQQKLLNSDLDMLDTEMDVIERNRVNLMDQLQKKYGEGQVDINTGTFIPFETPPTTP